MNIVALLFVRNEATVLHRSLQHLHREGISFFVTDNGSTDATPEIIRSFAGSGLIGSDTFPYDGTFRFAAMLHHQQALSTQLGADWYIRYDADEFRTSNRPGETLHDAIVRIDQAGDNAINFQEYTFIPTREAPVHHPDTFPETMRSYYAFLPAPLHRLNAWKASVGPVDMVTDGGHRVLFGGRRIHAESLPMRHYLYTSEQHFRAKYQNRQHPEEETRRGWHGWRERAHTLPWLPPRAADLNTFDPHRPWDLDPTTPRTTHLIDSPASAR
jgi:hypothetical protein